MSLLATQVEQIARIGANIEISPSATYLATQIESMIRIVKAKDANIKIHAGTYLAAQLEQFSRIGGSNVTIVV